MGARGVSASDSFIEEVTEEGRRDRLFAMIRRYGWIAVLAVLTLVGGAAWNEWRKAQDVAAAQTLGDGIVAALEADDSDWAAKERDTLGTKSPQTCKVALRQLREGTAMDSFADEMRNEYRIGYHVLVMHDFIEGVRALIVDKDNDPKWNPATPEEVTDEWIDAIFAPLPANEEWKPL